MEALSIAPRQPFPLRAGKWIEAIKPVRDFVPPQVWVPPEPIGEAILLSDDETQMGFQESAPGKLRLIVLFLQPGQKASFKRSTELAAEADEPGSITFRVS